jgi:hypothetical protein
MARVTGTEIEYTGADLVHDEHEAEGEKAHITDPGPCLFAGYSTASRAGTWKWITYRLSARAPTPMTGAPYYVHISTHVAETGRLQNPAAWARSTTRLSTTGTQVFTRL